MCYHAHFGTMRRLVAVIFAALTVGYVLGAHRFYEQERWARQVTASEAIGVAPNRIHHPEAAIGLVRENLARFRYRSTERELIERALETTPAFYEPPFLLATFHANRLEAAGSILEGYELAVERFPVNGRLRLAYGVWLLEARQNLDVWRAIGDPLERAEPELEAAMALEPELTSTALEALGDARVPAERWVELASNDPMSRRHLLDALFRAGRFDLGVEVASQDGSEGTVPLRRMAELALRGERPDVAVDAAREWLASVEAARGPGTDSFVPAVTLFRAYVAAGDETAADRLLSDVQARIESVHGISSHVSVEFLCLAGEEYLRLGRLLASETFFGEAQLRSPSYVPAALGLARVAARNGDDATAESQYRRILRLDPGHVAARAELATIVARRER